MSTIKGFHRIQGQLHIEIRKMIDSCIPNLLVDPAIEQRSLHVAAPTTGRVATQNGVVVGEDGSVLGDNVEEVDPTGLNGLGDVVISCSEGRE